MCIRDRVRECAPKEYRFLEQKSVERLVAAPLEKDGELLGYLAVDNPPADQCANIGSLLQTLCYFLLIARSNAQSQRQLSHMSYFDTLTSFYNRNRYIEDTNALVHTCLLYTSRCV